MSEPDEYVPGSDPRRAIADDLVTKRQSRRYLQGSLVGAHLPKEYEHDALDELLDDLAERVARRLDDDEPDLGSPSRLKSARSRTAAFLRGRVPESPAGWCGACGLTACPLTSAPPLTTMDDTAATTRYLQASLRHLDEALANLERQPDSPKRTEARNLLGEARARLLRTFLSFPQPEQTHDS